MVLFGPVKGSRQMKSLPGCDQNCMCRISGEKLSSSFSKPGTLKRAWPVCGAASPKSNSRSLPNWSEFNPGTSPRTSPFLPAGQLKYGCHPGETGNGLLPVLRTQSSISKPAGNILQVCSHRETEPEFHRERSLFRHQS